MGSAALRLRFRGMEGAVTTEISISEDGGHSVEFSTARLDAAAVQFHRKRGISIYREGKGGSRERVSPDTAEFIAHIDRATRIMGSVP